jgi:hypothetical protein
MPKASAARRNSPPPAPPPPADAPTRSPVLVQSLVVFGLAVCVRAFHLLAMRDALICDAWGYDQWARRIASGQWLVLPDPAVPLPAVSDLCRVP